MSKEEQLLLKRNSFLEKELIAKNRELEIETSLETVRARTMTMQTSEELKEVIQAVYEQLVHLKILVEHAGFILDYKTRDDLHIWLADQHLVPSEVTIPWFDSVPNNSINEAKENGQDFFKYLLTFEEKNKFYRDLFKFVPGVPQETLEYYFNCPGLAGSGVLLDNIGLYIENFSGTIYTDEENDILMRFGKVFQQTYTRFLDLQKAEAQAREAEIELGLERVRAKAMAMQSSAELKEVVKTLFEELRNLDVNLQACLIATFDSVTCDQRSWIIHRKTDEPYSFLIPCNEQPFYQEMRKAWNERNANWSYLLEGEAKTEWEKFLFKDTEFRLLPKEVKEEMHKAKKVFFAASYYQYGAIQASSPELLSNTSIDILQRFSKVFDSCYTRFLDLKKAESLARESQIQLGLERVRARTMAMQKSTELQETTLVLFQQFKALGATTAQVSICLIDEQSLKGEMFVTLNGEKIDRSFHMELDKETFVMNKVVKAFQNKEKSISVIVKGKKLQEYNRWRNQLIEKKGWDESDAILNQSWYVNSVFFSGGMMGISSEKQPSEEAIILLERFTAVFEQTYTRFQDLKKAESQAREAQIQLALERVRARTMAMQKSDELSETVFVLFEQFKELGEHPDQATIGIINENEKVIEYWVTMYGQPINKVFRFSIDEPNVTGKIYKAWKKNKKSLVIDLSGKALSEFMEYRSGKGGAVINPDEKRRIINVAFFSKGLLNVQSTKERSQQSIILLERFASVFEQTYTRFLDLQKAEAQGRESQIQLALERVRAKTMAMQKPSEFVDVINIIGEQFMHLDFDFDWVNFSANGLDVSKAIDIWNFVVVPGLYQGATRLIIPFFEHPVFANAEQSVKKYHTSGNSFTVVLLDKKDKDTFLDHLFTNTIYKDLPEEVKTSQYNREVYQTSNVILKDTWLSVGKYDATPLTDEQIRILKRLANEFGQAYTRFLDLQKAEAQAREASIEAGLERVRSRAMAMQSSEELAALIGTVFTELTRLDLALTRCVIWIFNPETNGATWWMANSEDARNPINCDLPYNPYEPYLVFLEQWQKRANKFQYELSGKIKKGWDDYLFSETGLSRLPAVVIEGMKAPERVFLTASFNNFGAMNAATLEPLSVDHLDVLLRFAKVFDLTYTRFNDLKQAEAQAREAKIQLGLERVRAKSLAMHHSSELQEVVNIVAQQLHNMNIDMNGGVFICINKEVDKDVPLWAAAGAADYVHKVVVPNAAIPAISGLRNAIKKANNFLEEEFSNEEKKEFFSELFKYEPWKSLSDERKKELLSREGGYARSVAVMQHTSIAMINHNGKIFSLEENEILKRFAKVFEQAYIRFLDLQKAEAQAREAQIEAALERARSKTMAMHESSDLLDVIKILGDQFQLLDFKIHSVNFNTSYRQKDWDLWLYNPGAPVYPEQLHVPYLDHPFFNRTLESIAKGSELNAFVFTKEEKDGFLDHLYSKTIARNTPEERKKFSYGAPGFAWSAVYLKNTALTIANYDAEPYTEEQNAILRRFGNVFEQSYTRFLDLQKAESQAREAEIQLALERVRARSLAMHHTSELQEVVNIVAEQLHHINIDINGGVIISINDEVDNDIPLWASAGAVGYVHKIVVPFLDKPVFMHLRDAIKRRNNFLVEEYTPEEKIVFFKHLFKCAPWNTASEKSKSELLSREGGYTRSVVVLNFTTIGIINDNGKKFSAEDNAILKRFGNVFEQAYTRFLDLEKAEAQAREAQIHLALERVRARTMAMQKSKELLDIIIVVSEELQHLGIKFGNVSFGVNNPDYDMQLWMAVKGYPKAYRIEWTFLDNPGVTRLKEAQQHPKKVFADVLTQKENNEWLQHIFSCNPALDIFTDESKSYLLNTPGYARSIIIMKDIFLVIGNYAVIPYSDVENKIFKRFANAFEQTYSRFLDLQKAEEQTREAQIEAGLERVRSRAMGMQTSEELNALIGTVFTELTKLDLILTRCVIEIYEGSEKGCRWWMANSEAPATPMNFFVKYANMPFFNEYLKGWHNRSLKWQYILTGRNKIKTDDFLFNETDLSHLPAFVIEGMRAPGRVYLNASFNNFGNLTLASLEPLSNEHADILLRFAKVFDLTYTRFNDLKQAEAQARESQIQLALERVRARTMAMQHSNELSETTAILFRQMNELGNTPERLNIGIIKEDKGFVETWATEQGGYQINYSFNARLDEPTTIAKLYEGWKTKKASMVVDLSGKELKQWIRYLQHELKMPVKEELLQNRRVQTVAYFKEGFILITSPEPLPVETISLLVRFAEVFNLTYTRFLDLKKAEAQAREAEIELALERVRAQSMAMSKSEDLALVVSSVFNELEKLNVKALRCGIGIINGSTRSNKAWITTSTNMGKTIELSGDEPLSGHTLLDTIFINWKAQKSFSYILEGNDLINYYKTVGSTNFQGSFAKEVLSNSNVRHFYHCVMFPAGGLFTFSETPFSDEIYHVLKRFGDAFYHAYKRFEDLQRAEAQAREAQIEAALERVRAKAMAMHNSNDVSVAASMVFSELRKLGIDPIRCGVGLLNKESRKAQLYSATSSSDGDSLSLVGWVMLTGHAVLENIYDTWLKKEDYYPELTGPQLRSYYENLLAGLSLPTVPNWQTGEKQYGHFFSFSIGCLYAWSDRQYNDSEIKILKRFAAIIDLTFRRFLDLQKAEAQAREARIEASLERVRGKAMAMHSSQDLSDTIGTFYQELKSFSLTPMRCGVGLLDKEERIGEMFTWNTTDQGEGFELAGRLKMEGHTVLNNIYESWLQQREYHPVLRGDEIKEYYKVLKPQIDFPDNTRDDVLFGYFFFFQEGGVYAWTEKEMQEDELQIYRRFTSVLSLTYKRYRDLEKAEASAKEAVKQSALDRIRADIASMRTVSDLDRITPLVWNELTILGVPFIRCGVFIMDDEEQQIHTFLSTPEGKGIAAFHMRYNTPGNIRLVISHWQKKEIYTDHWNEEAFKEFADNLVKQGAMKSSTQYLSTMPAGGFNLHFVPFQQGMLYVGNIAPLGEEEMNLLQSLADAFSTAYARYEDFNKLEAAKQHIEKTLTELKQAQQQLVQSEKMASLGELTAGIAHEIQNPLNFVNNFSEVSVELVDEMNEEFAKGNNEEAKLIALDLKENLEKINHHGKRAGDIVKGMLQHSRKSSGQKEPTDINALADEYLRLSYHGLRAKDKTFNATMKTDFDSSVEKINIIPQDIGRVLLNLFNNAFYAVNEQKSSRPISYNPTVSVKTEKCDDKIYINVRDNGNGIPQKILDKVFQPFFTTKPTGQGTGLGLSLSYDIVKAHGGEIKVKSKEGKGSQFVIQLPTK